MKFFHRFEAPVAPLFPDVWLNIRDYGAVEGKGCTEAIAAAIRDCEQRGGGHVVIPAGRWLTGPIHFRSNIDLHVEKGAFVEFSQVFEDYLPPVFGILNGIRCHCPSHLLYARGCKNIALTGNGTLEGHGEVWWPMKYAQSGMEDLNRANKERRPVERRVYDKVEDGVRPRMLQFVDCENVLIEGVALRNSPSWHVHPVWCKNIIVRNISIKAPFRVAHNTDGINLEGCNRGLVENCFIDTEDDIMCLKAGKDEDGRDVGIPCENIEIRNCRAVHGGGGVVVGSEMSGGVRNIWVHDCQYENAASALRIKTMRGRGGIIENIDFENLSVVDAYSFAADITMNYTGEPLDDHNQPIHDMPTIRNISMKGISCQNAPRGFVIDGVKGYEIENIYMEDLFVGKTPEAVSIHHAKGVYMNNVCAGERKEALFQD